MEPQTAAGKGGRFLVVRFAEKIAADGSYAGYVGDELCVALCRDLLRTLNPEGEQKESESRTPCSGNSLMVPSFGPLVNDQGLLLRGSWLCELSSKWDLSSRWDTKPV